MIFLIIFTEIDFLIVTHFIFIAMLKVIHFAFFATNLFSTRISRKQYKLEGWNLL